MAMPALLESLRASAYVIPTDGPEEAWPPLTTSISHATARRRCIFMPHAPRRGCSGA
jgi:hypothetical protein